MENILSPYVNTKTAIRCTTREQSIEIGRLMEELGGRSLADRHNDQKEIYYGMEGITVHTNCYSDTNYYPLNSFLIVEASSLIQHEGIKQDYQIF